MSEKTISDRIVGIGKVLLVPAAVSLLAYGALTSKTDAAVGRLSHLSDRVDSSDARLRVVESDDSSTKAYMADIKDELHDVNAKLDAIQAHAPYLR